MNNKKAYLVFFLLSLSVYLLNYYYYVKNEYLYNQYTENEHITIFLNNNPKEQDVESVLNVLKDYDNYFSDVYIHTAEQFKNNNFIKLSNDIKELEFLLSFYDCASFKELVYFLSNQININMIIDNVNLHDVKALENIIKNIDYYLFYSQIINLDSYSEILNYPIDKNVKVKLKTKKTFINKEEKHEYFKNIFDVIDSIDKTIYKINKVNVNSDYVFDIASKYTDIELDVEDIAICHVESYNDLVEINKLVHNSLKDVHIESLQQYLTDDSFSGVKYNLIKKFILDNNLKTKNYDILPINEFNKITNDLLDKYRNAIKNEDMFPVEIHALINTIKNLNKNLQEDIDRQSYILFQQELIDLRHTQIKSFLNLEPIDINLVNKEVLKDFYEKEKSYYIAKVKIYNNNYSAEKFVNKAFKKKTSLNNKIQYYDRLFMMMSLFLIILISYLIFNIVKRNNGK